MSREEWDKHFEKEDRLMAVIKWSVVLAVLVGGGLLLLFTGR